MIEKTIEQITETELDTEKKIYTLERRWNLRLKAEKITNIKKLKYHKLTIRQKMQIQKNERIEIINNEIQKMKKDTDKKIKTLEESNIEKREEILDLIKNKLKDLS